MLVVANEIARRISRKRRFPGSRQAEEERGIATLADVGGAVHAKDFLLRQHVIHHGEHRLLELAGVARATDQDHALGKVQHDKGAGARSVAGGIGLHFGSVQHREVRHEAVESGAVGADEHVPHERHLPRVWRYVTYRETEVRVGAAVQILHEQFRLPAEICLHVREKRVKMGRVHLAIHISPIHVVVGRRVANDELVLGGPAGVRCGDCGERSHVGELAFLTPSRGAEELRWHHVEMNFTGGRQALILE